MLAPLTRCHCYQQPLRCRRAVGAAGMWRRGWRPLIMALRCGGTRRPRTPREPHHTRSCAATNLVRARASPGSYRGVGPAELSSCSALRGGSATSAGSLGRDPGRQGQRKVNSRACGREQEDASLKALDNFTPASEGGAGSGSGRAVSGGMAAGGARDEAPPEGPAGGAEPAGMQGSVGPLASIQGARRTEQAGRSSTAEPAFRSEGARELPRAPWQRDAGQACTSSAAEPAGMQDSKEQQPPEAWLNAVERDGRAADRMYGVRSAHAAAAWREDDSDSEGSSGSGVGSEEELELTMRRTSPRSSDGVGRWGFAGGAGSDNEGAADEAEDGMEEWAGEDEGADEDTDEANEDGDGVDEAGALHDMEAADEAPGDLKARAAAQARCRSIEHPIPCCHEMPYLHRLAVRI